MPLTKVSYSMIQGSAVNLVDYGIEYTTIYNQAIAQQNKLKIEQALRDTSHEFFILPPSDKTLFICGSIHPLRSNLTIWQQAGCNIVGYSENSGVSFAGHLFGFVQYQDPDNGDFTVTGTTENVTYVLDGDIQTAFSPSTFGGDYNNNAIAFYDNENCQVVGTGGISKSNHDGINFDGLANNCHVDINYVKDCSTVNIQMIGSGVSFNSVKAQYVYNDLFDDTVNQPTARSCIIVGGNKVDVDIGSIVSTKAFPIINVQSVTEHAQIALGSVDGNGSHLVRMYNTKAITVSKALYSNLQYVVSVAGAPGDEGTFKNIILQNVTCVNTSVVNTSKIVNLEITPNSFQRLIVRNCDFGLSTGFTEIVNSFVCPYFDVSNTKLPATYNYLDAAVPAIRSVKLANYSDTTFTFNSNTIYGIITSVKLQVIANTGLGSRFLEDVDLITFASSAIPTYLININATVGDVSVTRTGSSYTFTAPAGYMFALVYGQYA